MAVSDLRLFFNTICEEYQDSDIVILSSDNHILYSRKSLNVLRDFHDQNEVYRLWQDEEKNYYHRFQLRLTDITQIFMLVPRTRSLLPEEIIYRLLILKQDLLEQDYRQISFPFAGRFMFFMDQLINKYSSENAALVAKLAEELHIDLAVPRVICLLDLGSAPGGTDHRKVSVIRELTDQLEMGNLIRNEDLVYTESESELLILRSIDPKISVKKQLDSPLQDILSASRSCLGHPIHIAIGTVAFESAHYQQSYRIAKDLLNMENAGPILFVSDHLPYLLLEYTPVKTLEHFFSSRAHVIREHPEYLETIQELIASGMNISLAAQQNHMHRNTMLLHTNQLRDALGLDPINRESDRLTMELLYYYCMWYQNPLR